MNQTAKDRKLTEALEILKAISLPREQQNERSALCLLALIDLKPTDHWSLASARLMGITPMMDWMKAHYSKDYAPNTRETVRRQTMHQFVQAGIALYNPDDPSRPTNSPKAVYQLEPSSLQLIRVFGTDEWNRLLADFLRKNPALSQRYAKNRSQRLVPVNLPVGSIIGLSPGSHSELIKAIIEDFAPHFAPNAKLVYVGDTGDKFCFFDEKLLASLGIMVDSHGKMPDVVLYQETKNWLMLVESVTSHGPVNPKRHVELTSLFASSTASLIFITAFPTRSVMKAYLTDIAWETEVWLSDNPSHLIHFDGERFLGLYNAE